MQRRAAFTPQPQRDSFPPKRAGERGVSYQTLLDQLPAHLDWGCRRIRQAARTAPPLKQTQKRILSRVQSLPEPDQDKTTIETLTVYPELAAALLREQLVAAGRIWMLLRFLNNKGSGWIAIEEAKAALTEKRSALRVCGWRQLRNLFNQGDAIFWRRANGRIWLTSLPKLLRHLDVTRLQQNCVAIPLSIWLGKIGTLRAHLYASFHSSRSGNDQSTNQAAPIARATLETITSVSPRIQRLYEQTASVSQQRNFCVGARYSDEQYREAAWQHGTAVFKMIDGKGKRGHSGQAYIAWQLPNSYVGPHDRHQTQQRKRINRRLADLLNKGTAGNGRSNEFKYARNRFEMRYFANGRLAAKAHSKQTPSAAYWPQPNNKKQTQLWYKMETEQLSSII